MTKLTMIVLERVPVSLRGELARWMIELKAGVFVGRLSALVRDKLWRKITEKKRSGGAILVQVKDNEQHFEIIMDGFPDRSVIDYDGFQLVRVNERPSQTASETSEEEVSELSEANPPPAKRKPGRKKAPKKPADTPPKHLNPTTAVSISPPSLIPAITINNSPGEETYFPPGFVERGIVAMLREGQLELNKDCKSTSTEHPPDTAWQADWMTDVARACNKILEVTSNIDASEIRDYAGKKIVAIDIETTNYIPKALQGFVNIIGIASMDFHDTINGAIPALHVYQLINTLRKRDLVPFLVERAWQQVAGADILLVFNKNFDIKILQALIDQHHLACNMPETIVDLMETFPNLESLEQELFRQTGFKRMQTQKGKYDEYYAAFKGKGSAGTGKKLEPIGTYNLLDVLTPLLYYILKRQEA